MCANEGSKENLLLPLVVCCDDVKWEEETHAWSSRSPRMQHTQRKNREKWDSRWKNEGTEEKEKQKTNKIFPRAIESVKSEQQQIE